MVWKIFLKFNINNLINGLECEMKKNIFKTLFILSLIIVLFLPYKLCSISIWDLLIYSNKKVNIEQNSLFDKSVYDLSLSACFFEYEAENNGSSGELVPGQDNNNQLMQGYVSLCKVGLNVKTKNFNYYNPSLDFQLFDYAILGNMDYSKHSVLVELKFLRIGREIENLRDNQWADFKLGYGYTFMNSLDKNIILSSELGIGLTSYEPDNDIFNLQDEQKYNNFNTGEPSLKIKGELFFNPIGAEFVMSNRWLLGTPTLQLTKYKTKLYYSPLEVLHHTGIDWQDYSIKKEFAFYLELEHQIYTQSKLSAKLNKISIGFDYYYNYKDHLTYKDFDIDEQLWLFANDIIENPDKINNLKNNYPELYGEEYIYDELSETAKDKTYINDLISYIKNDFANENHSSEIRRIGFNPYDVDPYKKHIKYHELTKDELLGFYIGKKENSITFVFIKHEGKFYILKIRY